MTQVSERSTSLRPPNPSIARVANRVVTPSMLVLALSGVDKTSLYSYFSLRQRVETNLVGFGSIIKNGLTMLPAGNYFHLFNMWGTGYYHWLTEVAPKFLMFETEIRDGIVLIPRNAPGFIKEFLNLIDYGQVRAVEKCSFVSELNIVTNPGVAHHDRSYIGRMRSRVLTAVGGGTGNPNRKIYVSRSRAARRKIINEEEVVSVLKGQGFEYFELEDLAFTEQAKLFSECKILVTIHGAALANTMFMPAGSRVIEFFPQAKNSTNAVNLCFKNLCEASDVQHQFLFCERRENEEYNFHLNDLRVDVSKLLQYVKNDSIERR